MRNRKHPRSLYDHNWRPEEVKTEGRSSQHLQSETSKRKREDQVNVCTVIRILTEAGDVSITMGIVPVWFYHKDNPNNKIYVYVFLDNASGGHIEIGLLISLTCPSTQGPRDINFGNEDESCAVWSALGWYVNVPANHRSSKQVHWHVAERNIEEQLRPQMVLQMFELDFAERENGIVLPKEEKWNRTSQRRSSVPKESGRRNLL